MPTSEKTTKKQRGRPTRHAGGKLSKNRTFKIYPDLDAKLVAAAAETGRTVSEEIERRLSRSFETEAAMGNPANLEIFHVVSAARARRQAGQTKRQGAYFIGTAGAAAFLAAAATIDDLQSVTVVAGEKDSEPLTVTVGAEKAEDGTTQPGPFTVHGIPMPETSNTSDLPPYLWETPEGRATLAQLPPYWWTTAEGRTAAREHLEKRHLANAMEEVLRGVNPKAKTVEVTWDDSPQDRDPKEGK